MASKGGGEIKRNRNFEIRVMKCLPNMFNIQIQCDTVKDDDRLNNKLNAKIPQNNKNWQSVTGIVTLFLCQKWL